MALLLIPLSFFLNFNKTRVFKGRLPFKYNNSHSIYNLYLINFCDYSGKFTAKVECYFSNENYTIDRLIFDGQGYLNDATLSLSYRVDDYQDDMICLFKGRCGVLNGYFQGNNSDIYAYVSYFDERSRDENKIKIEKGVLNTVTWRRRICFLFIYNFYLKKERLCRLFSEKKGESVRQRHQKKIELFFNKQSE